VFLLKASFTTVVVLALMSGCTSFKTVDSQSTAVTVSNLVIGDKVQIVTADGGKVRLTIETIEDDALIGDGVRVPIDDIRLVSIERIDPSKTAEAVIMAGLIVLCALLIAAIAVFP
jgi:hypothetical protein